METYPLARFTMHEGDKKRRQPARPALKQNLVLPLDHFKSADAASDVDAEYLGLFVRRYFEAGRLHGELAGRHGELNEAAHLLDVFFLDVLKRIEILYLACNLAAKLRGIELCDAANSRFPGLKRRPAFFGTGPD